MGLIRAVARLIGLALFFFTTVAQAVQLPSGITFIGLNKDGWRFYIVDKLGVRKISEIQEPRQGVWSPGRSELVYLDVEGNVKVHDLKSGKSTLLVPHDGRDAFTQFAFGANGDRLLAVRLHDRKSEVAKIVSWNKTRKQFEDFSEKRGASFDPGLKGNMLLYSFASCTVGCGHIVHDIWIKDVISGSARQLTRLNAISRQPVFQDANNIAFSSNADGHYRLWRYQISEDSALPITEPNYTDTDPIVDSNGRLFFIRREELRGKIMYWTGENAAPVDMKIDVMDVRNLEYAL